jgi:hypothetical protein
MRVAYTNSAGGWDATNQKRWDKELQRFRDLESSGISPLGTTHAEMDKTLRVKETVGKIKDAAARGDLSD